MALSFLNKKIWHPGSFANMEKTWVTEQKYREVEKRAIEKAKKIKEEKNRVMAEMKEYKISQNEMLTTILTCIVELGKEINTKSPIPTSIDKDHLTDFSLYAKKTLWHLNRLDFMYQCPQPEDGNNKNENEEFLLGKRFDDDNEENIIKKKKKKIIPKFADTYANPKNEEFVKIHEDPLYIILKEEKKQRKEIEQNPYKMKQILNDLKNDLYKNNNNNIKLNESEEETEKYEDKNKSKEKSKHSHHKHKHHHREHHHHRDHKHKKSYHH